MLTRDSIQIRDPYILAMEETRTYYLYGTTDKNCWGDHGTGFDAYRSVDLEHWEGPFEVFRPEPCFWADRNFWAPEVYAYGGQYVMFASFKSPDRCRGTQVLVSDSPLGAFRPLSTEPVTPPQWECLDGTLFIDDQDVPWMIFCHEWIQVKDGEMCAIQLTPDLCQSVGEPVVLFRASEAPWTSSVRDGSYVTDGPFLHRLSTGELLMLWSSIGEKGYAIGISRSESGTLQGPWIQTEEPLFGENGGHGMLFRTFEGKLMLAIHAPNKTPNERPVFFEVIEQNGRLQVK
jgi:arabinan endo-1,5-alpha-L-arabinosidase